MTSFNVLDRHQLIHRHALLEASAGTGKTFAIENLVVRLLIESFDRTPLTIDKILIVTFTRAATRDLKERIRINLERCLDILKRHLNQQDIFEIAPDYIKMHIDLGNEAVVKARRFIEKALFTFDQAQIFTIHGFCWRMLANFSIEGGVSVESKYNEGQASSTSKLLQVIRDFLRTEVSKKKYTQEQLRIILSKFSHRIKTLQSQLLKVIQRGIEVKSPLSNSELMDQFTQAMITLTQVCRYKRDEIYADYLQQSPFYKKSKEEDVDKLKQFLALFDKQLWDIRDLDVLIRDGIILLQILDLSQLKKKELKPFDLHYPNFLKDLKDLLLPIVESARSENLLFARMASDCQKFVCRYQAEEEVIGHHDLLTQMRQAILNPLFSAKVRSFFDVVVVDEFQDTDPIQWEVFSKLFTEDWKGYVYLVGDPKQSIYAFRQADIYTYLQAAERLGKEAFSTLNTNYRSQSTLVFALNTIFQAVTGLFPLPKKQSSLDFHPVEVGKKEHIQFSDEKPCVQFLVAYGDLGKDKLENFENDYFLLAIAQEILKLNRDDGVKFGQFAILISDRYQAERVSQYLKSCNIPIKSQKAKDLACSAALDEMRDLLFGILHCRSLGDLKIALGGRLIGLKHAELVGLTNEDKLVDMIEKSNRLRKIFTEEGFAKFHVQFLQSDWHSDQKSALEKLLSQSGGIEFYREWQDIADIIINEQSIKNLSPEGVIAFLDEFEMLSINDDERMKAYVDNEEEGVSILTTHVSKGLEYDIVFTLGLLKRTKKIEDFIPCDEDNHQYLVYVEKSDPLYEQYCQEIDAEKMRQLYVAFTRAKYRLYIPAIFSSEFSSIDKGCASPIDLFLARLNKNETDYSGLYQNISLNDGAGLEKFVESNNTLFSFAQLQEVSAISCARQEQNPSILISPNEIQIVVKQSFIQSFTSISHSNERSSFDVEGVPHNFITDIKNEHTLPSGSETGILFHSILEVLPFDCAKNISNFSSLIPAVRSIISGTLFEGWEDVLIRMIYRAFTFLLPEAGFSLMEINCKKIYRETEFLYPCADGEVLGSRPGFLKGVIDLFFEHQGKYYLIDWKSNWLGPSTEWYHLERLQEAVRANQYDLQAKIYIKALRRYLKLFDNRPFEEIFGGAYYVFLRGIGDNSGVLRLCGRGE